MHVGAAGRSLVTAIGTIHVNGAGHSLLAAIVTMYVNGAGHSLLVTMHVGNPLGLNLVPHLHGEHWLSLHIAFGSLLHALLLLHICFPGRLPFGPLVVPSGLARLPNSIAQLPFVQMVLDCFTQLLCLCFVLCLCDPEYPRKTSLRLS